MACPQCQQLNGNSTVPNQKCIHEWTSIPLNIVPATHPMGWECPKCHRVYAPGYPSCDTCGKVGQSGTPWKFDPGPTSLLQDPDARNECGNDLSSPSTYANPDKDPHSGLLVREPKKGPTHT